MPRRISTGKVRVCCEKSFHSLVKDIEVRLVLQSQSLQIDNEPGQITRRISHVVLVKIYDHLARATRHNVSRLQSARPVFPLGRPPTTVFPEPSPRATC